MQELIQKAESFVQESLTDSGVDSSHDFWHIDRVRKLALNLAGQENLSDEQKQIVELSALLHDVKDWKYSGNVNSTTEAVEKFFNQYENLISENQKDRVMNIIKKIGFKDELEKIQSEKEQSKVDEKNLENGKNIQNKRQKTEGVEDDDFALEFGCVQDADRLDAIGAIGIARCFTFGGKFNRVLHDPNIKPRDNLTKQQYIDQTNFQQTTINHFYEKLMKLKDLMKTQSGRKVAEERHMFMEEYLERFFGEWDGKM